MLFLSYYSYNLSCSFSSISASLHHGSNLVRQANPSSILSFEGTKERIKNMFEKIEVTVSSYDTAWVAMVPSPNSPHAPCFPECVKWLLDNQLDDGSWGLPHSHPLLVKDALSSTLACVLALKRWGIAEEHVIKGLKFIGSNFVSVSDDKQFTPIGFDIIFPGMIEYAGYLNLNLPLRSTDVDTMLHKRYFELERINGSNSEGGKAYLAYISEGMGKFLDWEMVMSYQRKNGSLFNSPSASAAALTHLQNTDCLHYLRSILEKFGNAVPTVYPVDIFARLSMVATLERLGIDRYFKNEIKAFVDEIYQYWLQGEEAIFLDPATCAMAFRILRVNGYDVASDLLSQLSEEHKFFNLLGGYLKDMDAVLEVYRASEIIIHPEELVLEKTNSWTSNFLRERLSSGSIHADKLNEYMSQEVDDALQFPYYLNVDRLAQRRSMEHHNVDNITLLKTSYCLNARNKFFLKLAVEDFNICQLIHQKEHEHLVRWVVEKRLDKLKFARQKMSYCYFSAAATLFSAELSDARISWAKSGVLTTVCDDFFDVGGSEEELVNLVKLLEMWNVNVSVDCCSEQVEIIFSALQSTILEIGEDALKWQGRNVTSHIIEIWLNLLKSMLKEAEWLRSKSVPTRDEYMENAYESFALGPIVLPAVYLVGPKLSDEVVRNSEFHKLYKLMGTVGRLLNDIRSYKRESAEGKLNAVSLHMIHGMDGITEEEAIEKLKALIDSRRRELLRLVLREKDSIIPRVCKDLFWKMIRVLHLFYMKDDGFTSDDMINVVNAVIHDPIVLR
ncbi:Terpene_synth domain-containing protein/Terpene_synth_C domain-containing protein [Cephalotus follicularis]|uniref:ent-kaurene synthase n=1 Tax=Cephalotus follicularis TaxID=3775 RepID=A0A1Q3BQT9_CEPFO|nr:Terpene_synth domain-containing protein/Terpene_synth_C domain-containing protein [Cephalotus follicularis]